VEGAAPEALREVGSVLRSDEPSAFPRQEAIFANMPAQEDACLRVPKVGEEET
jgi:Asp-tRNA(Asn)/Glu-tRNA(Gln) amidotransferase C subunit